MKKAERISSFVQQFAPADAAVHPCYAGYFQCFNEQRYYEAHDVLEHLWLQGRDENFAYYKGLIQVAGAFVHLQKQHLRPNHPKDSRRLRPAVRLFKLAQANLENYRPRHLCFDVEALYQLCARRIAEIEDSGYCENPWNPTRAPQLSLTIS